MADEPTGNLDAQNSKEVVQLLSELSKDRLVIMVTHNYDEVEQFATRKIRMYDGEVAEDIRLREAAPRGKERYERRETRATGCTQDKKRTEGAGKAHDSYDPGSKTT